MFSTIIRVRLVAIASLLGVALQFYTFHVEAQLDMNPGYQAACDFGNASWLPSFLQGSSCSKVFSSSYARPLSHFGLVERKTTFDLSLPWFGLAYFLVCLCFPIAVKKSANNPRYLEFYVLMGVGAVAFNLYLAGVLKFVLKEFCIVCASTYVLNGTCVVCFFTEYYASQKSKNKPKVKGN